MVQVVPQVTGLPPQTITQLLVRIGSFDTDATSTQLYFDGQTSGGTSVDSGNVILSGATFAGLAYSSGTTVTDIEDYVLGYVGLTRL